MDILQSQNQSSSRLFEQLCNSQTNAEQIYQILISFPQAEINKDLMQQFVNKNNLQQNYEQFIQFQNVKQNQEDPIIGQVIDTSLWNNVSFDKTVDIEDFRSQVKNNCDNVFTFQPKDMTFNGLCQYLVGQPQNIDQFSTYILQHLQFSPYLPQVFKLLPLQQQQLYAEKYLDVLTEQQLTQEQYSEYQQYLLILNKSKADLSDFGQQLSNDYNLYYDFLQGISVQNKKCYAIFDKRLQMFLQKLLGVNIDIQVFMMHFVAVNQTKFTEFPVDQVLKLQKELTTLAENYLDIPQFKLIHKQDLSFSFEVVSNATSNFTLNLYNVNTEIFVGDEIDLDCLQLKNPSQTQTFQNKFIKQMHAFTIHPKFQSNFIIVLQLGLQRQSFYIDFENHSPLQYLSSDMQKIEIFTITSHHQGFEDQKLNQTININLQSLPYEQINHQSIKFNEIFFNNLDNFHVQSQKLLQDPKFSIQTSINPEELLYADQIQFKLFLLSKIDCYNQHPLNQATIFIKSDTISKKIINPNSNKFYFSLPKVRKNIEISVQFNFNGKLVQLKETIQIKQNDKSIFKLIQLENNKFLTLNLLDKVVPCKEWRIDLSSYCGHLTTIVQSNENGEITVPDYQKIQFSDNNFSFNFTTKPQKFIYNFNTKQVNFTQQIYQNKFKIVDKIENFEKNYYIIFEGKFEEVQVYKEISDFRISSNTIQLKPQKLLEFELPLSTQFQENFSKNLSSLQRLQIVEFNSKNDAIIEKYLNGENYCNYEEIVSLNRINEQKNELMRMQDECDCEMEREGCNSFIRRDPTIIGLYQNTRNKFTDRKQKIMHKYSFFNTGDYSFEISQ